MYVYIPNSRNIPLKEKYCSHRSKFFSLREYPILKGFCHPGTQRGGYESGPHCKIGAKQGSVSINPFWEHMQSVHNQFRCHRMWAGILSGSTFFAYRNCKARQCVCKFWLLLCNQSNFISFDETSTL